MPEGRLTIGRRLPTCPTKSAQRAKKVTDSSTNRRGEVDAPRSERQPQSQLNQPGLVLGRGDNSEIRISQGRVRIGELHPVEEVEEFRMEFQFQAFSLLCMGHHREIEVRNAL